MLYLLPGILSAVLIYIGLQSSQLRTRARLCVCACMRACVCIYIYIHIHTHTNVYSGLKDVGHKENSTEKKLAYI